MSLDMKDGRSLRAKRRKCIVPSCKYVYGMNGHTLRSMFGCPKDVSKAQKWADQIPGIDVLKKSHSVCEIHFEPKFVTKNIQEGGLIKTRLTQDAYPSIFFDQSLNDFYMQLQTQTPDNNESNYHSLSAFLYNNMNDCDEPNSISDNSIINYDTQNTNSNSNINYQQIMPTANKNSTSHSQIQNENLNNNVVNSHQISSSSTQASLQDALKNLSASEKILMNIKREELTDEIKVEKMDEFPENVEMLPESREISIYENLKYNFNYIAPLLPDCWNASELPMGEKEVIVFSKECTIHENETLMVIYERNIVLHEDGNMVFSIHGKTIDTTHHDIPGSLEKLESLLGIILKFNDLLVCQGVSLDEVKINKGSNTYKDDLGYFRHTNCTLIADEKQCNICFKHSQHLLNLIMKRGNVINDRAMLSSNRVY